MAKEQPHIDDFQVMNYAFAIIYKKIPDGFYCNKNYNEYSITKILGHNPKMIGALNMAIEMNLKKESHFYFLYSFIQKQSKAIYSDPKIDEDDNLNLVCKYLTETLKMTDRELNIYIRRFDDKIKSIIADKNTMKEIKQRLEFMGK